MGERGGLVRHIHDAIIASGKKMLFCLSNKTESM